MKIRIFLAVLFVSLFSNSFSQENRYYITIGLGTAYCSQIPGGQSCPSINDVWVGYYLGGYNNQRTQFNPQLPEQSFAVYSKPPNFQIVAYTGNPGNYIACGSNSVTYTEGANPVYLTASCSNYGSTSSIPSVITVDDPIVITSVSFIDQSGNPVSGNIACLNNNYRIKIVTAPYYNNSMGENQLQVLHKTYYSWTTISGVTLNPSGGTIILSYDQLSSYIDYGQPIKFRTSKKQSDGGYSYSSSTNYLFYFPDFKLSGSGHVEVTQPNCFGESPIIRIPSNTTGDYVITIKGAADGSQGYNYNTSTLLSSGGYVGGYYIINNTTPSASVGQATAPLLPGDYNIKIEHSSAVGQNTPCAYSSDIHIVTIPEFKIVSTSYEYTDVDNAGTTVHIAKTGGLGQVNLAIEGSRTRSITIDAGSKSVTLDLATHYVVDGRAYYKGPAYIDLPAGTYSIRVSNSYCSADYPTEISLAEPAPVSFDTTATPVSCNVSSISGPKNDGTVIISNITGGVGAYTITPTASLENGKYVIRNLPYQESGHLVTITDENGNTTTKNILVPQNAPITFQIANVKAPSLSCSSDGTVEVGSPSGGVGGYTYSRLNEDNFQSNTVVGGYGVGSQPVYVKDLNSCVASSMANIPAAPPAIEISSPNEYSISPSCYEHNDGQYHCVVSNVLGTLSITDLDGRISAGNVSITGNKIDISGLAAGNEYSMTIVDTYNGSSCELPKTFSIAEKPAISFTSSVTHVKDKGTATGSVTIEVSGGNEGSRSFSLYNESNQLLDNVISSLNTVTFSGLAGDFLNGGRPYYVDVADVKSCSYSEDNSGKYLVRIQEPETKLKLSYSITQPIDCYGNGNASIALSASGGWTGQYMYSQNNLDWTSDNVFKNFSAGNHTFYVTDGNGGKDSVEVYFSQPAPLTVILDSSRNVLCKGTDTGWLRYNVSGGTFPYSFSPQQESFTTINGNDTLLTAKKLTAKTWVFQIVDKNGCSTSSFSNTITEPDLLTIPFTSITHTSCELNNGELFAKVAGGTSPYTYHWSGLNNGFNSTIAGLTSSDTSRVIGLEPNTYNVQVTDSNNCVVTSSLLTVNSYTNPIITDVQHTDVRCYGENNGAVQISAQGGTAALEKYTISSLNLAYSDTNSTGQFVQLMPDTYFAYVFDKNGCRSNLPFPSTIIQPKASVSLAVDSVYRVLGKGTPTGGIRSTIFGGNSGLKNVRLFNAEGTCIDSSLQRDQFPFNFNALYAGNYTISATDIKGCAVLTEPILVKEPDAALRFDVTEKKDALCKSQVGSITVQASGGWGGYRYKRESYNAFYKRNSFENLYAGNYIITVKDSVGATYSDTVAITEPKDSLRSWVSESLSPTCSNNGELKVGIVGGTAPYSLYNETTNDTLPIPLAQVVNLNGLGAGSHALRITDGNGCRFDLETALSDTLMMRIAFDIPSYPSADNPTGGAIKAIVTGGMQPFTYQWKNRFGASLSEPSATLKDIPSGHYELSVTGTDGCLGVADKYLPGLYDLPFAIAKLGNETSYLAHNGYCKLTSEFNSWKSFNLITPQNENLLLNAGDSTTLFYCKGDTISLQNLEGGDYFISGTTVSDSTVYAEFRIEPYQLFQFRSVSVVNVDTIGANNGEIVVVVTGGGGGNKFEWQRIVGSDGGTLTPQDYPESTVLSNITAGKYRVVVTDRYDNSIVDTVAVEEPATPLSISIADYKNESCKTYNDAYVTLKAEGGWGDYQFRDDNTPYYTNGDFFDKLGVRTHYFYLTDKMGVVDSVAIPITEPDYLTSQIAFVDSVNCKGGGDGRFEFNVNGGTAPYRFASAATPENWQEGTIAQNIAQGHYRYIFTDANECVGQDTVEVEMYEPDSLLFNKVDVTQTTCNTNNGAVKVLMQGGTQPYRYAWRDFNNELIGTDNFVTKLVQNGLYTLDVYDYHNCNQHWEQRINPSTSPVVTNVDTTPVLCFGGNTGKAFITGVTPGVPYAPYTFAWSNADTGSVASGFSKGVHFVTISDTNKCSTVKYFEITQPDSLRIVLTDRKDAHCFGYNDAFLQAEGRGGVGGYTYRWSTGDTTMRANNLYKGAYQLLLSDANKCLTEESFIVDEPEKLEVDLGDDIKMCPGNSRIIDGQDFATHKWFTAQGTVSNERYYTAKEANDYYLEVTNSIGCFAWDTINVSIGNDALQADFLLSSQAKLGDTLSIFELSNMPLDSLQWDYNNNAFTKISGEFNPDYVLYLKTLKEGIYNVNLYAFSGGCVSVATKQVEIIPESDTLPDDGNLGYKDPLIKSLVVSPNPNDGNFYATVELRETADIDLLLFAIVSSTKVDERFEHGLQNYSVGYNLSGLNSGVYLLILKAGNERKQVKIIIQ